MEIMTTKTCPEVQYKLWNLYDNVKHEHNFQQFIFKTYSEINIFNFEIEKYLGFLNSLRKFIICKIYLDLWIYEF